MNEEQDAVKQMATTLRGNHMSEVISRVEPTIKTGEPRKESSRFVLIGQFWKWLKNVKR